MSEPIGSVTKRPSTLFGQHHSENLRICPIGVSFPAVVSHAEADELHPTTTKTQTAVSLTKVRSTRTTQRSNLKERGILNPTGVSLRFSCLRQGK